MTQRLPLFAVRDLVCSKDSPFDSTERAVALCIGDHMGPDGRAWPSVRAISEWTGLHSRTVERALQKLTGPSGIFDRTPGGSTPGGARRASEYRLRSARATPGAKPGVDSQTPGTQPGVADENRDQTPGAAPEDPRHTTGVPPAHGRTEGPIEGPIEGNVKTPPEVPPSSEGRPGGGGVLLTERAIKAAERRIVAFAASRIGFRFTREDRREIRDSLRGGNTERQLMAKYRELVAHIDADLPPATNDNGGQEQDVGERAPPLEEPGTVHGRKGPVAITGGAGETRRTRDASG